MKKLIRKLFGGKSNKEHYSVGGRSAKSEGVNRGKSFSGSSTIKVDLKPLKKDLKEIKNLLIKIDSKL